MRTTASFLILSAALFVMSCQKSITMSESQKNQASDSAKVVIQKVIDGLNKVDFKASLQFYSNDPDATFIENGAVYPSLDVMKRTYEQLNPSFELLEVKPEKWHVIVLTEDAVSISLPMLLKLKMKGLSEYNGKYVWSGIVQKRNGRWQIVQSHESWLNQAEIIGAMTPSPKK